MFDSFFGINKNKEGILYRQHAVVKFLASFSLIVATGMVTVKGLVLLLVLGRLICLIDKLKIVDVLNFFRPFRFLLIFTFIVQLFITEKGGWTLPEVATFYHAVFMTGRMGMMILFSSFFAFFTPVTDIIKIFYFIFIPFKIFRISPKDLALSMLIALRFIPLLFSEGEKIADSQRLKGLMPLRGEKQSLLNIMKGAVSLVVPLFIRAFNYASNIAVTLNYRQHNDSFFKLPKILIGDYLKIVLISVIIFVILYIDKMQF